MLPPYSDNVVEVALVYTEFSISASLLVCNLQHFSNNHFTAGWYYQLDCYSKYKYAAEQHWEKSLWHIKHIHSSNFSQKTSHTPQKDFLRDWAFVLQALVKP
jgi:hypothetical protein